MKDGEWNGEGAEEKFGPKVKKDSGRVRDSMIGDPRLSTSSQSPLALT